MTAISKTLAWLGLGLVAVGVGGCGMVNGLRAKDGAEPAASGGTAGSAPTLTREAAYEAKMAGLLATSCEAYPAAFDKDFYCCSYGQSERARQVELNTAAAAKFGSCGQWAELFDRVPALEGYSDDVLSKLDAEHDLAARFVEVLARGGPIYTRPDANKAAGRFAAWLAAKKGAAECKAIVPHHKAIPEAVLPEIAFFHFKAGCGESVLPMARKNLTHDTPALRIQACDILGAYGKPSDIAKVDLLAKRDPYLVDGYFDSNRRWVEARYTVRDRCATAGTKLRLK